MAMEETFRYINIISKHTSAYLDRALVKYNLCSAHRTFIKKIYEKPGITRDTIKNIVHVHPSNTTRIIDDLEEKGYIIKKQSLDDKRICELYPTQALTEVYLYLNDVENSWTKIVTKGLSNEEKDNLNYLLKIVVNNSVDEIHKKEN